MKARRVFFLLAVVTALGASAACKGGGPATPEPPPASTETYTFKGRVWSQDLGVGGIKILLTGDASLSTTTDGDGNFSFTNVSGSSFVVTPWHASYTFDPASYSLGAQSRSDLNFTASQAAESLVGTTAPDFTGVDQSGRTVSLYSYRGQVIFIDICADWCGSCRVEAPQLEALYQAYRDQGLQVITILIDGSAAEWAAQYHQTFPVIEDKAGAISGRYQTGWVPVNIVIDRDMIIRFHQSIDYDEALFTSIIKSYL